MSMNRAADGAAGRNETIETVQTIAWALLIALVIKTLLFQPFTIPSASEEPNLYEGDYIVVSKWPYGYSHHSILFSPPLFKGRILATPPKRGDVVVFKLPRPETCNLLFIQTTCKVDYVKRLVGMPGDRLQVRQGVLFINDKPLPRTLVKEAEIDDHGYPEAARWMRETNPEGRSYVTQIHGEGMREADNTGVYVIPPHCYFMMGDNRQNSLDSRFDSGLAPEDPALGGCGWDSRVDAYVPMEAGVGFVPEENLVGRAEMVLVSWKKGSSIFLPWTWLNLRGDRFFKLIH